MGEATLANALESENEDVGVEHGHELRELLLLDERYFGLRRRLFEEGERRNGGVRGKDGKCSRQHEPQYRTRGDGVGVIIQLHHHTTPDTDTPGCIDKAAVLQALQSNGESHDQAREALQHASVDASGKVELEDWLEVRPLYSSSTSNFVLKAKGAGLSTKADKVTVQGSYATVSHTINEDERTEFTNHINGQEWEEEGDGNQKIFVIIMTIRDIIAICFTVHLDSILISGLRTLAAMTIESLSIDVLSVVASLLSLADIARLRQVPKFFYDFTHAKMIWNNLYRTSRLPRPPGPYVSQSAR
ncbi:hypothetical protein BV22DRAFT_1052465 [Leucogyrophana mollusca]|uniref:Uncharacterized protein n=1 Tax=Leucogyrophana mollusca TaxID=85980 RepID=A0ACB8AY91_9AGAM|nr:hypothetical protein BV22DRAFT_1052465 [Leucogyrophana mollusca]